jgi:UDP-glucose 4-epimerase
MRSGPPKANDGGDMCYVKDCGLGIQMAHMAPSLEHRIYNIGTGQATRNADLVTYIKGVVPEFEADLPPGGDVTDRYLDLTRTTADTGYTPRYGVEKGLVEYVDWLRTHDR